MLYRWLKKEKFDIFHRNMENKNQINLKKKTPNRSKTNMLCFKYSEYLYVKIEKFEKSVIRRKLVNTKYQWLCEKGKSTDIS